MGYEDLKQAITTAAAEVCRGRGDVGGQSTAGRELKEHGVHGVILP